MRQRKWKYSHCLRVALNTPPPPMPLPRQKKLKNERKRGAGGFDFGDASSCDAKLKWLLRCSHPGPPKNKEDFTTRKDAKWHFPCGSAPFPRGNREEESREREVGLGRRGGIKPAHLQSITASGIPLNPAWLQDIHQPSARIITEVGGRLWDKQTVQNPAAEKHAGKIRDDSHRAVFQLRVQFKKNPQLSFVCDDFFFSQIRCMFSLCELPPTTHLYSIKNSEAKTPHHTHTHALASPTPHEKFGHTSLFSLPDILFNSGYLEHPPLDLPLQKHTPHEKIRRPVWHVSLCPDGMPTPKTGIDFL